MRIWRHLKMLKRGGRGQDPHGAEGTQEGELAIECPACPHPGRNLPEGWENAPPEIRSGCIVLVWEYLMLTRTERWLYTLFIAVDANFRMALKDKSLSDLELAPGWAYLVEEQKFQDHLKTYKDQTEVRFAKVFAGLSQADAIYRSIRVVRSMMRCSMPIRATKMAILSLARASHNVHVTPSCARTVSVIYRKVKGKLSRHSQHLYHSFMSQCRFCNMDYIILSALIGLCLLRIIISYDIACQWSKNLSTRMLQYPEHMRINPDRVEIRTAVPGFHIRAHGADCQQLFSFSFLLWVARTVGEEVETGWAHMNLASPSIQEMGPGHRHEVLNDHWGGWNFQKTLTFSK